MTDPAPASASSLSATVRSAVKSDRGLVRETNEDAFSVIKTGESRGFFVADGMGGPSKGEIASHLALSTLESFLKSKKTVSQADVRTAIEKANQAIVELAESGPHFAGMGTTITGIVFTGDAAFIAHVGNSRVYRLRRAELKQLTSDHTLDAELGGTEDVIPQTPGNHMLTRSLGSVVELEIDLFELVEPPLDGDVYLCCTDGLFDAVMVDELTDILRGAPLEDSAREMIALARERGGKDNITALVVHVGEVKSGAAISGNAANSTAEVISAGSAEPSSAVAEVAVDTTKNLETKPESEASSLLDFDDIDDDFIRELLEDLDDEGEGLLLDEDDNTPHAKERTGATAKDSDAVKPKQKLKRKRKRNRKRKNVEAVAKDTSSDDVPVSKEALITTAVVASKNGAVKELAPSVAPDKTPQDEPQSEINENSDDIIEDLDLDELDEEFENTVPEEENEHDFAERVNQGTDRSSDVTSLQGRSSAFGFRPMRIAAALCVGFLVGAVIEVGSRFFAGNSKSPPIVAVNDAGVAGETADESVDLAKVRVAARRDVLEDGEIPTGRSTDAAMVQKVAARAPVTTLDRASITKTEAPSTAAKGTLESAEKTTKRFMVVARETVQDIQAGSERSLVSQLRARSERGPSLNGAQLVSDLNRLENPRARSIMVEVVGAIEESVNETDKRLLALAERQDETNRLLSALLESISAIRVEKASDNSVAKGTIKP